MSVFDFRVLKALSSHTRLSIIRRLRSGHMTLSDLSAHFGMHPSSVKEHLEILERADLIKMEDSGRKWKYYSLTPSGADISNGGELKIALPALFGVAFLWISARGFGSSGNIAGLSSGQELMSAAAKASEPGISDGVSKAAVQAQPIQFFPLLLAAIGIALLSFSIIAWLDRRKARS